MSAVDPISAEAVQAIINATPSQGMTPLGRAAWCLEVGGKALDQCRMGTADALWHADPHRATYVSPSELPDFKGTRSITLTERDYKRLQVYERAHKMAIRTAELAMSALSNLYLDHIRTLDTIRDANSLPKRSAPASTTEGRDAR